MSPVVKKRGDVRPPGQIRQSQVVTTFGPGAMVDLPEHAVIIGGLDHWTGWREHPIEEERLAEKVKRLLGLASVGFYAPPPDVDDPQAPITGITAWEFPEWFIVQMERKDPATGVRSRPLVHRLDLTKRRYEWERKRYRTVPVRFVQACTAGHVTDINWRLFVHGPNDTCQRAPLWMDERGTSGDLTAITVRCECGQVKALSAATKLSDLPLGYCDGRRPWLGAYGKESCRTRDNKPRPSRLLIRAASNAYFSQTLSVISIPDPDNAVKAAVDPVWANFLQYCESEADVGNERRKAIVSAAIEAFSDADVWAEIRRRQGGHPPSPKGIRDVEIETLMSSKAELGSDQPGGDFYARSVALPAQPVSVISRLERVVKVHRLREVIAQVGFTRFESAVADIQGELEIGVERADLARAMTWVPAVENRGEGVFVALKAQAVNDWLERPAVKARANRLSAGFDAWKARHKGVSTTFPGAAYVMLHSLSHLLITAIALDCGYAASSIRERIYAGPAGYGILLYTASPDAEGTLGGLVEAAGRIGYYLRQAIDLGQLCANDPVCAHHQPNRKEEERYLLGAACHGCLLLAESSCERRNDFLDRVLVVPTVGEADAAFFSAEA